MALPLPVVRLVEIDAEHFDRAGAFRQQPDDGAHQHRLAGARGTDEAEHFAAQHVESTPVSTGRVIET